MESEQKIVSAVKDFSEFEQKLLLLQKPEEKIRWCLDFMRSSISLPKAPRFRDFWESKRLCLPFFKEELAPQVRAELWQQYIEISTEGRHLKEVLDEQSAFAMEQLELAIAALEQDLDKFEELLAQMPEIAHLEYSHSVKEKIDIYSTLQRELNLLNTMAARVNGLRKEVMKTDMRIRFKNKFLQRLSKAGDRIFPRRKELIQNVSTEYLADVTHFGQECKAVEKRVPLSVLRDEIKTLQALAKELTLDTPTFNGAREVLSQCWDLVKEKEQEKRAEFAERREAFDKNAAVVRDKIKAMTARCEQETTTLEDAGKISKEITQFMRGIELGREDVYALKDEIEKAKAPIYERLKKAQVERERLIEDSRRQKQEKMAGLKTQIEESLKAVLTMQELTDAKQKWSKEIEQLGPTMAEKEIFHDLFKHARDQILARREESLKSLSPDDQKSLKHLNSMLEEHKLQRQEIKSQLDFYRRELSGSGFDFEKAMRLRELIDSEKIHLDKIDAAIDELEDKISDIEEA